MNAQDTGVDFRAMTDDEQAAAIGGDGYLAGLIGNGAGSAVGFFVRIMTTPWHLYGMQIRT